MRTAALWFLLVAAAARAGDDGVGQPQPESGGGLPLTLTVFNPSKVDATLFRVVTPKKMDLQGVVHPGSSMAVTTLPGQKFVAFFPCHERRATHVVPRVIADEWKLTRRPCG